MLPILSGAVLSAQSDERLLELSTRGHERAFEMLVHRYRKSLVGYCRRRLLDTDQADDVVQQALLSAWTSLRNGTEVRDVKPWLFRIVHNTALNSLRGARYDFEQLNDALQGDDAPDADLDRRIAIRQALAGLAALPEMQREALLRTAVEGHSHAQVAQDLGVSDTVVRGLVYRARVTLRSAASALTPPPLVAWAAGRLAGGQGVPGLAQASLGASGGGTAGIALLLAKSSAIVVGAGAVTLGAMNVNTPPAKPAAAHAASASEGRGGGKAGNGSYAGSGHRGQARAAVVNGHLMASRDAARNNLLLVNLAPQTHVPAPVSARTQTTPSSGGGGPASASAPSSTSTTPSPPSGGSSGDGSTTTPSSPGATTVQTASGTVGGGYWTSKTTSTSNTSANTATSTTTTPASGTPTGGSTPVTSQKDTVSSSTSTGPPGSASH